MTAFQWFGANSFPHGPPGPKVRTPAKAGTMAGADLGAKVTQETYSGNISTYQPVEAIVAAGNGRAPHRGPFLVTHVLHVLPSPVRIINRSDVADEKAA